MKTNILIVLLISNAFLSMGQVSSVLFEAKNHATYDELKGATVHVIIKDFCDDSKPYKKILQEYWKHSKLSFDYETKYDSFDSEKKGLGAEGDWFMYFERNQQSHLNNSVNSMSTYIIVGKKVGKNSIDPVIYLPIMPAPGKENKVGFPYTFIDESVNVSKCFLNLANEYYLKNTLQILDQFVDKKIENSKSYNKTQLNCESLQKVLSSTLYIPQYVGVSSTKYRDDLAYVETDKYFKGYEAKYKILTEKEITAKFKAGESFFYLLYSAGCYKHFFIVESVTGKIMSISGEGDIGYSIEKNDMANLYEYLKNNKDCK